MYISQGIATVSHSLSWK